MDEEDIIESYTWVTFKFKTIRVLDNIITAHNNVLKVEIGIEADTTETDVNIVLEKIHFWFETIVSNSVIFSRDNEFALGMMFDENGNARTQNIPMIVPGEPTDDFLVMIFQAKLAAFGAGVMGFGTVEMTSDTRENLTTVFVGEGEEYLPSMEEWIGEHSYFEYPWWARDDGTTLDVIPPEDADLADPPFIGIDMSFIEARYKKNEQEGPMIIKPEFRPTVISGGKDSNDNPEKD